MSSLTQRPAGIVLLLLGWMSSTPAASSPDYVDVTKSRNINFIGSYGSTFVEDDMAVFQRNMGNGAAVGDYDGDGDLDILLLGQRGRPNVLLRNDLDLGLKWFTDVTNRAGVGASPSR